MSIDELRIEKIISDTILLYHIHVTVLLIERR
jgi:hypothetical protein